MLATLVTRRFAVGISPRHVGRSLRPALSRCGLAAFKRHQGEIKRIVATIDFLIQHGLRFFTADESESVGPFLLCHVHP